jgi:hypothetical protein
MGCKGSMCRWWWWFCWVGPGLCGHDSNNISMSWQVTASLSVNDKTGKEGLAALHAGSDHLYQASIAAAP